MAKAETSFKTLLIAFGCLVSMWAIYSVCVFWQDWKEFTYGRTFEELHLAVALNLMDSVETGLEKYRLAHGHYPNVEGKYFMDSLKAYIGVSHIYVYADSILPDGTRKPIDKPVAREFNYKEIQNTFLGVGSTHTTITYKPHAQDSFLLYSTGENGVDEGGGGDDIVQPSKNNPKPGHSE